MIENQDAFILPPREKLNCSLQKSSNMAQGSKKLMAYLLYENYLSEIHYIEGFKWHLMGIYHEML